MNKIFSLDNHRGAKELYKSFKKNDIVGYKIGAALALKFGLKHCVDMIRSKRPDSFIIYDHQKAGTDLEHTAAEFANVMQYSGVDAGILFPRFNQFGVLRQWISQLQIVGVHPIVGGFMTNYVSLNEEEAKAIYSVALGCGVNGFILPGNAPDFILSLFNTLPRLKEKIHYVPGFKNQGGCLDEMEEVLGDVEWYPILGRSLREELLNEK